MDADPILVKADLSEVRLSHVRDRLGQLPSSGSHAQAVAEAILTATSDLLVVREMAVIGQLPRSGERPWQATDRFLAEVWAGKPGCDVAAEDLRWAYLREVGRYKHPASWTVWDAQFPCCPETEACRPTAACLQQAHAAAAEFAGGVRTRLAGLPALGVAADVTDTALDASAVRLSHVPAFEEEVANQKPTAPAIRLRRYRFFRQSEPGFPKGHFLATDPAIEAAMAKARLGDVVGPLVTGWGVDVVLLVARDPVRSGGLDDPAVAASVRSQVCTELAMRERVEYRERLLGGASVKWQKASILKAFGAEAFGKLPPDVKVRAQPDVPSDM